MADMRDFTSVLVELTNVVERVFADACREYHLTPQQCRLLYLLRGGPVGMGRLSELLMLEKSSLSGLVDRGVRRGLVRRVDAPHDRRVRQAEVTGEGERVVSEVWRTVDARLVELSARLPADERHQLSILIGSILDAPAEPTIAA